MVMCFLLQATEHTAGIQFAFWLVIHLLYKPNHRTCTSVDAVLWRQSAHHGVQCEQSQLEPISASESLNYFIAKWTVFECVTASHGDKGQTSVKPRLTSRDQVPSHHRTAGWL